jgi:anti-sigma-K factor RskA
MLSVDAALTKCRRSPIRSRRLWLACVMTSAGVVLVLAEAAFALRVGGAPTVAGLAGRHARHVAADSSEAMPRRCTEVVARSPARLRMSSWLLTAVTCSC